VDDLAKLIAAYALTSGLHTAGHFNAANQNGENMRLDGLAETYVPRNEVNRARLSGSGFKIQDDINGALSDTDLARQSNLANVLYKSAYLLNLPKTLSGNNLVDDFDGIDKSKGKNYAREMLALSALSDLYRAYNPGSTRLSFDQSPSGTPLLMLEGKW